MNKYLIQALIILIVVLLGISLVSESNDKLETKKEISAFETSLSEDKEIENGSLSNVRVVEEDSSNIISDINAKIATLVVDGLNAFFNLGIKLIEGIAG